MKLKDISFELSKLKLSTDFYYKRSLNNDEEYFGNLDDILRMMSNVRLLNDAFIIHFLSNRGIRFRV